MKKAFTCIALCIAIQAVAADHYCDFVEGVARTTMQARQNGASMGKVMDAALSIQDKNINLIAKDIVETAYEKPHFRTDAHKKRAIDGHANEWAAICWRKYK